MERKATLSSKLVALVLSLALAVSFTCVGNLAQAQAAENNTVTFTIVAGTTTDYTTYETSYNVWLNQEYAFTEGQTMADLLETAKAAGDIKDYEGTTSDYGLFLTGITSASGTTISNWASDDYLVNMYWSVYADGVYSAVGASSVTLEAGHKYQLAYNAVRYDADWNPIAEISTPVDWDAFYNSGSDDPQPSVEKSANQITVKTASKTYKAKALKKASQSFTIGAKAKTTVSYSVSAKVKKAGVTVSKTGKVTVKKGTKKGTYKITVKAAETSEYKAASKTVKVIVK